MRAEQSKSYLKKEAIREEMQDYFAEKIVSRKIRTQEELDEFTNTVKMSVNALGLVPFEAWKKILKRDHTA